MIIMLEEERLPSSFPNRANHFQLASSFGTENRQPTIGQHFGPGGSGRFEILELRLKNRRYNRTTPALPPTSSRLLASIVKFKKNREGGRPTRVRNYNDLFVLRRSTQIDSSGKMCHPHWTRDRLKCLPRSWVPLYYYNVSGFNYQIL
jgi:hypothetical protein